jgi:hypothetical protein
MTGVPNPNFKGFIANWNVVQIVYGSGKSNEPTIDRE